MRNLIAVLMLAAGLTAMPADASGFISGNTLAEYCVAPEDGSFNGGVCAGFILGVSQTLNNTHYQDYDKACTPSSASVMQLIKVTERHLDDNPDKLHNMAAFLVTNALIEAFDCNTGLSYPNL